MWALPPNPKMTLVVCTGGSRPKLDQASPRVRSDRRTAMPPVADRQAKNALAIARAALSRASTLSGMPAQLNLIRLTEVAAKHRQQVSSDLLRMWSACRAERDKPSYGSMTSFGCPSSTRAQLSRWLRSS